MNNSTRSRYAPLSDHLHPGSPSNGETYESRIEVIRILLMKGAKVKASTLQNSVFCDYSAHAHDRLKTFGLVDALIAAIDPSVDAESPLHTQEGLKLFRAAADAILEMRNEPKQNAERTRNLVQAMSKVDLHALQQLLSLRPAA